MKDVGDVLGIIKEATDDFMLIDPDGVPYVNEFSESEYKAFGVQMWYERMMAMD